MIPVCENAKDHMRRIFEEDEVVDQTQTCPHKFHWANINMDCELEEGHESEHSGTYEYSKVTWLDGDRRDYLGKLTKCLEKTCILPGGHRGNHAY